MQEQYKVIEDFKDLEDNEHIYIAGKDIYPREGLEPSKKRIKELSTDKNKIGKILIKKVENEEIIEQPKETKKAENEEKLEILENTENDKKEEKTEIVE